MNDQERRAEKVALRDRALLLIRQADAFLLVVTAGDSLAAIRSTDPTAHSLKRDLIIAAVDSIVAPLSDQEALELLQAIETYVHDRAEEIIAELEERKKE